MRRSRHVDDGPLDELLDRLGESAGSIDDDALRAIARAATEAPRELHASPARSRRPALAWTIVPVAVALLVGSGLGFGLAGSATPAGEAGTAFAGFGFVPARGWTVLQSGTSDASGTARAIAGNFVLPHGALMDAPATVPPRGILIAVTFSPRGSPGVDVRYPTRELPLQIADARPVNAQGENEGGRSLARYRLRAGVGGYNVDALIVFGLPQPQPILAAAQRQLDRLVVASERVTIFASPVVQGGELLRVSGSIDARSAGQTVDVQARDCGQRFFRGVAGATTDASGTWSTSFYAWTTTTLRAIWRDSASSQITVRARARVSLNRTRSGQIQVWVTGMSQFWRRRALIQRRSGGRWRPAQLITLTETGAQDPTGRSGAVWSRATFRLSVPSGTLVRAVFPLSQARPCYLAGVSNTLRT